MEAASGISRNTALDANQWYQNLQDVQTNWRNQQEYTLSVGGPIIKNKTFFFVSWDHQISRIREHNVNIQVPTPCARKGIFRYFDGYSNGNFLTNPSAAISQVRAYSVFGPMLKEIPANDFDCASVAVDPSTGMPTADWVDYNNPWDELRRPDTTGYVSKFMGLIRDLHPNNYDVGDGLN